MSARLDFRDAVVERFASAFGNRQDCRAMYENGPKLDMNHLTVPVVACEIVYYGSRQAEFAENPATRDDGEILITVLVKDMGGSRAAYALRDEASGLFQRSSLGGAVLHTAAMIQNSSSVAGWVGYRAAIPFWHYHY